MITGYSDTITLDRSAPTAVTDLAALRGKDKVTLTWTNPGGDQTGVEVWRAVWHTGDDVTSAYPEYDDVNPTIPAWPADHAAAVASAEWVLAGSVTVPDAYLVDGSLGRGIYYYVVYSVDGAGHYGAGANVSSISYLLGDLAPDDGAVTGGDITVLSLAYGTSDPGGDYNNECDVGPTDDYSGSGIPTTDNFINFEDLMIFALNWDVTVTKSQPTEGSLIARLSWVRVDDTTWSLVLVEPCANLKGVNLRANLPEDGVLSLTAGDLLGQQNSSYFLQNIPRNGLDAGLALLGRGACIRGQGELIRIELAGDFDPDDILITARDSGNKDLGYTMEEGPVVLDTPTRYAISANYPNPFKPSTKIDFALPESQHVQIMIFSIDGRRVATLKNESMSAGRYTATWMGKDDQGEPVGSGIYFYRIQAGDFSRIQKMTLLK